MVVAATGFFDGVHLGHRMVIEQMRSVASEKGCGSMIVTFWPHPRSVLQQDADRLRLLTTLEEKRELCLGLGVDSFQVLQFSREFSLMSAEEFVKGCLVDQLGVSTLILGYDHRLGHDSFDSPEQMMEVVASCGVEPVRVAEFSMDEAAVSSTRIRNCLLEGDVKGAKAMLGYRYGLHGVVVAGNRIGRTIGFPTANIQLYEPLKLVPGNGVYAVTVEVLGERYKGVCNIGTRPTVGLGGGRTIEVHILNFDSDIYGLDLKMRFVTRMRDERRFDSLDALKEQLRLDCQLAEKIIVW